MRIFFLATSLSVWRPGASARPTSHLHDSLHTEVRQVPSDSAGRNIRNFTLKPGLHGMVIRPNGYIQSVGDGRARDAGVQAGAYVAGVDGSIVTDSRKLLFSYEHGSGPYSLMVADKPNPQSNMQALLIASAYAPMACVGLYSFAIVISLGIFCPVAARGRQVVASAGNESETERQHAASTGDEPAKGRQRAASSGQVPESELQPLRLRELKEAQVLPIFLQPVVIVFAVIARLTAYLGNGVKLWKSLLFSVQWIFTLYGLYMLSRNDLLCKERQISAKACSKLAVITRVMSLAWLFWMLGSLFSPDSDCSLSVLVFTTDWVCIFDILCNCGIACFSASSYTAFSSAFACAIFSLCDEIDAVTQSVPKVSEGESFDELIHNGVDIVIVKANPPLGKLGIPFLGVCMSVFVKALWRVALISIQMQMVDVSLVTELDLCFSMSAALILLAVPTQIDVSLRDLRQALNDYRGTNRLDHIKVQGVEQLLRYQNDGKGFGLKAAPANIVVNSDLVATILGQSVMMYGIGVAAAESIYKINAGETHDMVVVVRKLEELRQAIESIRAANATTALRAANATTALLTKV